MSVEKDQVHSSDNKEVKELEGIYPYSQQAKSRGITIPEWEKWEKVRLSSGVIGVDSVAVPWSNTFSNTVIPTQVRKDIKSENGWMLLRYTVNGNFGKNNSYMFFYNKYTGILKVFYYCESNTPSSTGIWHIRIDVPQKLFAFIDELADPINGIYQKQDVYCTNKTASGTTGFTYGWNYFQIELAYDPQLTEGTLYINPINRTSSNITLTGSYNSSSKGALIATTQTNSEKGTLDGFAKAAGEDAFNFVKDETKEKKFAKEILDKIGNIAHEGVTTIVSGGINKLFSSFIGRFNKTQTQNYDLQFTTNGKAELSGSISTETTGGLSPASLNLSPDVLGIRLGVWNLEEQPIIYFDPTAKLLTSGEGKFPVYHLWRMNGGIMDQTSYSYKFKINPDIVNELTSYQCSLDTYALDSLPQGIEKYPHGSIARKDKSEGGIISSNGTIVYEDYKKVTNYYKKFKVYFPNHPVQSSSPQRILFLPKGDIDRTYENVGVSYTQVIKASAWLYVNNNINDTIVITKTFAPKLEWDPQLYEANKDEYIEPFTILQDIVP
ncbi:MAG: hypothetical protein LUI85_06275 [Bacteroides sp.]|nr:hypothetical protein [Bacteroides sp.]